MGTDERTVDTYAESPFGDSNPSSSISPPDAGESDDYVLTFYDTDDSSNTRGDPVVEREYHLGPDERDEAAARLDTELDLDMIIRLESMIMLAKRDVIYDVLDTVTEDE